MLCTRCNVSFFASLVLLAGTSSGRAADLTGSDITKLISGNTIYVEFEAGNANTGPGPGFLYYSADGKVAAKFPNGNAPKGIWVIKDDTSCITFDGQPPSPCTRYDKQGDVIILINTASGKPRGKIVKTETGNKEKL